MASVTLLTPDVITKESLMILENNLVAANRVNRKFENQFTKIGATLTIRKPNRFTVSDGRALSVQDIAEPSTSITIDKQKHVDFEFTSADLTLTVEEFKSRYLDPAMATLANQVDYDVLQNVLSIPDYVGTPGVTPATFSSGPQLVGQRMDENAAAQQERCLILTPAAYWATANGLSPSFVMPTAKEALVKGYLSTIGNMDVYMDQNLPLLATTAAQHNTSVAMVITSATFTGTTTQMYGGTATENIAVGECFTVAGVNNVNPQTRQSTGQLKVFTVTATSTPTGSTWTINFSPSVATGGPYQNISVPLGVASSVTWLSGTTTAQITNQEQNIAFQRDAFGLVMVPLEIPGGVDFAARETYRNISMRTIRSYDINNDVFPTRIDLLYGDAVYYEELACRLAG
jgi:hypothetical protein